jgi:hypothetical protein
MTERNIRECHISSSSGNPCIEISPSSIHKCNESKNMIDIPLDSHSSSNLPQRPLIDLQNSPLEFSQESIIYLDLS